MALFGRKSRTERIAESAATAALEKAGLAGTPLGNATASMAPGAAMVQPYQQMVGLDQTTSAAVAPLARDANTFAAALGPAMPFIPIPLDPTNDNGRPDPRKFQYQVATNLQLQQQLAQWNLLAASAVQIDLFARAIAIRTGDVTKMDWSFDVTKTAIKRIMDDDNLSHAEAAKVARQANMDAIVKASEFLENPYPQSDRGWQEWITEALWQVLVYDGLVIHPRYTLGRDLLGLDIIEASTIKVLLDNYGDTPRPPDPAYQQILWGFPRGEFIATPDKDVTSFTDSQYDVTERDQLSYFVMNRRTNSPYGLSPVEQALQIANVYVERLKWLTAEYTNGTTARVYLRTNTNEITLANLSGFNRVINDWMQGQTANRQTHVALPMGYDPIFSPQIDEKFKPEYDEMLIKRVAGFFGVQPSQFGVIPRAGMGGGKGAAEGEQDQAETISSKPQNAYLERCINSLMWRYLGIPKTVEFTLHDDEGSEDKVETSKAMQTFVFSGQKTINEARADQGLPALEIPEADEAMIVAGNAVTFLKGLLDSEQPGTSAPPPSPQDGTPQAQGTQPEAPAQEGGDAQSGGQAPEVDVAPPKDTPAPEPASNKAVQLDELRDFATFVKSRMKRGNWRAFEFGTLDESTAELLNERAYFIVKGATPTPENLFGYFAEEVERASLGENPKVLL